MAHTPFAPRPGARAPQRRRHTITVVVAVLSLSLLVVALVGAAPALRRGKVPGATLKQEKKPVVWQGVAGPEDVPTAGVPSPCAIVTCDHFQLKLALPAGTFGDPERPGGVQVAVRWNGEFDTLNLFVSKSGILRAASAGIIATAQSALLKNPENGTYDVWVASDPAYSLNASVAYEARAEVEYAPALHPVGALLPDLTMRDTRTITFATPSYPRFEPDPPPGSTCFLSEMEEGAQTCLRFDQVIANVGQAALELQFAIPKDPIDPGNYVTQRVFASDGSYQEQPAGDWEYHPTHQHYHYRSFAITYLYEANQKGEALSVNPVRTSEKVSFCIADHEIDAWGARGDGPRSYSTVNCLSPMAADATYEYLVQGLTQGWSDVYQWYLPDQYIEVSGLPDGYYRMELCADPDGLIEELDETNNCTNHLIRLVQVGTPQRSVIDLGPVK